MEFRSSNDIRMGYTESGELATSKAEATSFKVYIKDNKMNSKHAGPVTYLRSQLRWNSKENTISLLSGEHEGSFVGVNSDGNLYVTKKQSDQCKFQTVKHKDFVRGRYFGKDATCASMPIGQKERLLTRELNEGEEMRITLDMHGHTSGTAKLMLKRRIACFQEDASEFGNVYSINIISPGKAIPAAVREVLEALHVQYAQRGEAFIVRLQPGEIKDSSEHAVKTEPVLVQEVKDAKKSSFFGLWSK
jgi:hypothetical protein